MQKFYVYDNEREETPLCWRPTLDAAIETAVGICENEWVIRDGRGGKIVALWNDE